MRDLGARLVAVSPQIPERNADVVKRHRLAFPVLSDAGNGYAKQLSLVFSLPEDLREIYRSFEIVLPEFNGDDSWALPIPARFVVGGDGRILSVDADPDYTRRPEPSATLDVLRSLS
jgi:peroxiredoxin